MELPAKYLSSLANNSRAVAVLPPRRVYCGAAVGKEDICTPGREENNTRKRSNYQNEVRPVAGTPPATHTLATTTASTHQRCTGALRRRMRQPRCNALHISTTEQGRKASRQPRFGQRGCPNATKNPGCNRPPPRKDGAALRLHWHSSVTLPIPRQRQGHERSHRQPPSTRSGTSRESSIGGSRPATRGSKYLLQPVDAKVAGTMGRTNGQRNGDLSTMGNRRRRPRAAVPSLQSQEQVSLDAGPGEPRSLSRLGTVAVGEVKVSPWIRHSA